MERSSLKSKVTGAQRKRKRISAVANDGVGPSIVSNKTSKTTESYGDSDKEKKYEVKDILHKITCNHKDYYLVKWSGYPMKYNSWESLENLNCSELFDAYNNKIRNKNTKKCSYHNPPENESSSDCVSTTTAVTADTVLVANTSTLNDKASSDSANTSDVVCTADKRKEKVDDFECLLETHEPDYIVGAKNVDGIYKFLIKWKGEDNADFVLFKDANIKWPQMVIKFYEERFHWSNEI